MCSKQTVGFFAHAGLLNRQKGCGDNSLGRRIQYLADLLKDFRPQLQELGPKGKALCQTAK